MNKKDKEKFMGRPLQGIEDKGKPKPAEAPFFDQTYRKPNDATAAMVMQKASEDGKYQFKSDNALGTFDDCPEFGNKADNVRDWTGFKWGRLRVVGYGYSRTLRKKNGQSKGNIKYWIVRCVCGRYEYRTNKILLKVAKNAREGAPMCGVCDRTDLARKGINAK